MIHENMFGFCVVEAKQGEILEDRKEQPTVNLGYFLISHDADVA